MFDWLTPLVAFDILGAVWVTTGLVVLKIGFPRPRSHRFVGAGAMLAWGVYIGGQGLALWGSYLILGVLFNFAIAAWVIASAALHRHQTETCEAKVRELMLARKKLWSDS